MQFVPRLQQIEVRFEDLTRQLADPALIADAAEYRKAAKARSDIAEVVDKYREWKKAASEFDQARGMLQDQDPDLRQMATDEAARLEPELARIEQEIKVLLLPKDPNDDKNVVLEIRAGTGGDEATLFAAEVFRMYSRYAETQRWRIEVTSASESSAGGLKEVIALVSGDRVYSRLKYESGVHRVQRVPVTEQQGRVHTSAITAAVLPEADEVEVKTFQVPFVEHDHMVEQIPAAVADKAFCNPVLPRTTEAGSFRLGAEVFHRVDDFLIEVCTAIEDQVAGSREIGR